MADWNDLARVWFNLQRKEEELRWSGSPGTGPQYDSMGRRADSSLFSWGREQFGRVSRLRDALDRSGPMAQRLITQNLAGLNLTTIWDTLVSACKDVAIYYCGTVAAGSVIGGAGGAFFGGVGAVPGAAAGAAAGSYLGGVVLAMLGLKSILEEATLSLPDVLVHYQRGFVEAWGPNRQDVQHGLGTNSRGDPYAAAGNFASGHVVLITAILSGLLAYITRGRGGKTALLTEIGRSKRLGPRVAQWMEANEERLRQHPALQSRRRNAATSETPSPARKPEPGKGQDQKTRSPTITTAEQSPGAVLRQKYAHLSASETVALRESKAEANALRRLQEMESSTPKAHYLEKHGAQLNLQSQFDRAAHGINPTTKQIQYAPPAATRFLSHRDQLNVINRSESIFRTTGDITAAQLPIRFDSAIGSGFQKVTLKYGHQYSGQVYLNSSGKAVTAFPVWGQ